MRAIGLAIRRCSIEFCRELRFKATARVFELSFSPRNVGQHCVQPLWTQYQEPEHKHEQDFCAKTHDHSLVTRWSLATMIVVLTGFSSSACIADLKPRIPSPIPLPSSGSFLGPNTSNAIPKITSRCIG